MDPEIVERLNEQLREMSDILSQQNASMAAMMKAMNDQAAAAAKAGAATKNQTNAANANATATEGITKKQLAYQQAEQERIEKANQTIERFNKVLDGTIGTLSKLGTAVTDITPGFQKYNSIIGGAGDAAFDVGRKFGILGAVLGGVVKGFTFIVEKQFEQADNLLKFNDTVSKLGAVNSFSSKEILEMGHKAGFAAKDLEKLSAPIQKLGSNFKTIGQGAEDSTRRFMQMVTVATEVSEEFQRLGYNKEQLVEAQAGYIELMGSAGVSLRSFTTSLGGLQKVSLEYVKNLQVLSELSGLSAEDEQAKMKAAAADKQFQLYLLEMNKKIAAATTKEEKERLSQQVTYAMAAKASVTETLGEEAGRGFGQMLAGVPVTEGIPTLAVTNMYDELRGMAAASRETKLTPQMIAEAQNLAVKRQEGLLGEGGALRAGAGVSDEVLNLTGGLGALQGTVRLQNYDALKAVNETISKLEANSPIGPDGKPKEPTGPAATDDAQKARAELTRLERDAAIKMDQLISDMNPLLGNFGKFAMLSAAAVAATVALGGLALASLGKGAAGLLGKGPAGGFGGGGPGGAGGKGISTPANLQSQKDLRMDYARQLRKRGFSPKESLRIARDQYPNSSFAEFDKKATAITKNSQMSKLERLTSRFSSNVDDLGKMSKMGKALGTANKWLGRAAVPLTVLSAGVEGFMGYKAASDQEKAGQITSEEAKKKKGEAIGGAVGGGLGGAAGGALAGATLGSVVPVVGTAIGGILGGALGYYLGNKAGTAIGGAIAGPGAPKPDQQSAKDQESRNRTMEYANTQFTKTVASFGSIVTSFGKIVVAFAITSKAFSTSVRAYAESTNKLGTIVNNIGNKKSDEPDKNSESLFAKTVTIFGSLVTSFGKIVTANATVTTAFAISVKAFATTVTKLAELVRAPQQKNTAIDSVAKALAENKPSERLQRRQSNLENVLGNTLLESEDALTPIERYEKSIVSLTKANDFLREAEFKRHTFNEISMKQFRDSITDLTKSIGKITGIDRTETKDDKEDKAGASPSGGTGAGSSENAQKAMDYFMKQGWTKEQAAGIVGNLQQESGKDLDPNAENSIGMYGIAQWDKTRRRQFEKVMGRTIYGSSLEEQLAFIQHELTEGKDAHAKKGGRELRSAKTATEAAMIFENRYERSGGHALGKRVANAEALVRDNARDNAPRADQQLVSSKPANVKLGDDVSLSGVRSDLLSKFFTAAKEFRGPVTINSAYRTDKKQAELWVRGNILRESGIHTPARPKHDTTINYRGKEYNVKGSGTGSKHGQGEALDISGDLGRLDPILGKYGLTRPFKRSDPPHLELQARKGGVFDGPDSGYPVEMHGSEMIAPLSTNSVLMKLAKTPADSEEVKQVVTPTNTSSEKETIEKIVSMNSEMMDAMLNRLDEMVNAINDGNDTRQKILKNSQN